MDEISMITENTKLIRFYYLMFYPSQDLLNVSLYNHCKFDLFNICAFLGLVEAQCVCLYLFLCALGQAELSSF